MEDRSVWENLLDNFIWVVCIDNKRTHSKEKSHRLTLNKKYIAFIATENSYIVDGWWEFKTKFITLEEYRQNQLDKLV
jgi:hypothetical protein